MTFKRILFVIVAFLIISSPAFASIDVPTLIKQVTVKHHGIMKLSEKQAVAQLDAMLIQQYAAQGPISAEKNAYLKSLYYQAATLLMNGYPIAGGTIVSIARIQPGFSQSPGGHGLANFVDAMLQPSDEEDAVLEQYMDRTKKAQSVLRELSRQELQLVAQLYVVGYIYHDDIAIEAGKSGFAALKITVAERKVIDKAIKVE